VCYRQYPVDGQFGEGLPDGQKVDEDPDESSDETDDGDEQKPVRASQNDGRGAGHAHDAKHLATDRQAINKQTALHISVSTFSELNVRNFDRSG
jgi:hypothetical protein